MHSPNRESHYGHVKALLERLELFDLRSFSTRPSRWRCRRRVAPRFSEYRARLSSESSCRGWPIVPIVNAGHKLWAPTWEDDKAERKCALLAVSLPPSIYVYYIDDYAFLLLRARTCGITPVMSHNS